MTQKDNIFVIAAAKEKQYCYKLQSILKLNIYWLAKELKKNA